MTCHNCRHQREITRLREICSRCELSETNAVSKTTSLDALVDGADDRLIRKDRAVADAMRRPSPYVTELPAETEDAFRQILSCLATVNYERVHDIITLARQFEGLDRVEFGIVQHFLNGGTVATYSNAFNLSRQTAHARIKALFRHKPTLAVIANGLYGKLKGGRKPNAANLNQHDLFSFSNAPAHEV